MPRYFYRYGRENFYREYTKKKENVIRNIQMISRFEDYSEYRAFNMYSSMIKILN